MKIYLVHHNGMQAITASKYLAEQFKKQKGHEDTRIYECELKTQGSNFHSWAKDIKEIW